MAAHESILENDSKMSKHLSLRYQVLCDQTALIGVVKQKAKTTGDIKEYEMSFDKCTRISESLAP